MKINQTVEWQQLVHNAQKNKSLREFFQDNERFEKFSLKNKYLLLDYSKNNISEKSLSLIFKLFHKRHLKKKINAMFQGEKINFTENRAVLHTALRDFKNPQVKDKSIRLNIQKQLQDMKALSNSIIQGKYLGFTKKPISDVVNIGIGGSYLGIKLALEALTPYRNHLRCHFIANIDGIETQTVLKKINPQTTLFVLVSKSFTTIETLTNAITIKKWLKKQFPQKNIMKNFLAVTANKKAATDFGIVPKNILHFGDYIGGRFSLFSSVGFVIMLGLGYQFFQKLLQGAEEMDEHFRSTPFSKNLPVILAALGIWQINFLNNPNQLILPYCHYLKFLPNYLQQLDMESNGKSITQQGLSTDYSTGPFIWGEVGTTGQHSFYQSLHQGPHAFTADFIGIKQVKNTFANHQKILLANMLAQSEALATGLTQEEFLKNPNNQSFPLGLISHRLFKGNKPSTTILLEKLDPKTLGYIIALYEHKIFTQGVFWDINSFDQWGVELGKKIATKIENLLQKNPQGDREFSSSTYGLVQEINSLKQKTKGNEKLKGLKNE